MPFSLPSGKLFGAGLLCCAALASSLLYLSAGRAAVRDLAKRADPWKELNYQEASNCMDCHTAPAKRYLDRGSLDFVLMTEYAIWRTHDKHAQAYAVLEGPRGKAMAKILKVDITQETAGCLHCHAMVNLRSKAGKGLDKLDGVSCGGCHGPSDQWIGPHADPTLWRGKSPEEKYKLGMRDVRDPEKRAEMCISCHIGNATEGKVVTHAMFAAGHPPLPPIEMATFSRNEPQHWRDTRDVPYFRNSTEQVRKNYHLEDLAFQRTKFALIGSVVALRETMRLAAERADFMAQNPQQVWPELLRGLTEEDAKDEPRLRQRAEEHWTEVALAHSDCYGCHHDLKVPAYRQRRGFGYHLSTQLTVPVRPGRPLLRAWPLALVEPAAWHAGQEARVAALRTHVKKLANACNARPFGQPEEVRTVAAGFIAWCDDLIDALRRATYDRKSALTLMHHLCYLFEKASSAKEPGRVPDYEAARQIASLLQVVYDDWRGSTAADPEARKVLASLEEELGLQPYVRRKERTRLVLEVIQTAMKQPKVEGIDEFSRYLEHIGDEEMLKKLFANQFLRTLQFGVSNKDFTEGFQRQINRFQDLSNQELDISLKRVAGYDPDRFVGLLDEFARTLPRPAKP